jgi:hypothetical protein
MVRDGTPVVSAHGVANEGYGTMLTLGAIDRNSSQALLTGLRFQVDVPANARVLAAYLALRSERNQSGSADFHVRAELAAEASPFPASATPLLYALAARQRTIRFLDWQDVPVSAHDVTVITPDLVHVVREVVALPSWTSGAHLSLLISGEGVRTYDGPLGQGPQLSVYFLPADPAAPESYTLSLLDDASDAVTEFSSNGSAYLATPLYAQPGSVFDGNGDSVWEPAGSPDGAWVTKQLPGGLPSIVLGELGTPARDPLLVALRFSNIQAQDTFQPVCHYCCMRDGNI